MLITYSKNAMGDYSKVQLKVRNLTNNDRWGNAPQEMQGICEELDNAESRHDIMVAIRERWTEETLTWRKVYKSLVLYEYLLLHGPSSFVSGLQREFKGDGQDLTRLTQFDYTDSHGKDQGINVRNRATKIVSLLKDSEALEEARQEAASNRRTMLERKCESQRTSSKWLKKDYTPSTEPLSADASREAINNDSFGINRAPKLTKMPSVSLMGLESDADEEFDEFQTANPEPEVDKVQVVDIPIKETKAAPDSLAGFLKMHSNLIDLDDTT